MTQSSIIAKIRALLSKTVDNGCTEAEAMMAAAKAASLMDQYELSPESIDVGVTKASGEHYTRHGFDHPISLCAGSVALFTGTTIFRDTRAKVRVDYNLFGESSTTREQGRLLCVVGLDHEVAIARYVLDICANALDTAAAKGLAEENAERTRGKEPILVGIERRNWVLAFQQGMATRMATSLREMAQERSGKMTQLTNSGCGRSLVTVRRDLIAEWLKSENLNLSPGGRQNVRGGSGFDAGKAAGAGVRFHAGMASGQRAALALN